MDCPPHDIDIKTVPGGGQRLRPCHQSTPATPSLKTIARSPRPSREPAPRRSSAHRRAPLPCCQPRRSRRPGPSIGSGARNFDYTCKEVAKAVRSDTIAGLSYRDKEGKIKHNPEREMIPNMDALPWVPTSISAICKSRSISSATCSSLCEPVHRVADAPPNAPSAFGRRPSAGTNTVSAPAEVSPTEMALHEEALPAGARVFLRR